MFFIYPQRLPTSSLAEDWLGIVQQRNENSELIFDSETELKIQKCEHRDNNFKLVDREVEV